MASEILVNDGGAPCRIIPMVVAVANVSEKNFLGVALTDANVGEVCNVVTGRGVVVRINCADVNGGVALMAGDTAGRLKTMADGTGIFNHPVAITLEDNGAAGLTKCLTI
jgi:hypothetical protein